MKKIFIGALTLIAIIGLAGCANPNVITKDEMKTIKFLNDSEVKQLFTGKTLKGKVYKHNNTFELSYAADGKVSGKVADGKQDYTAKWYLNEGNELNYCFVRPTGKETCKKIATDGKKYYAVTKDNEKTSEFMPK